MNEILRGDFVYCHIFHQYLWQNKVLAVYRYAKLLPVFKINFLTVAHPYSFEAFDIGRVERVYLYSNFRKPARWLTDHTKLISDKCLKSCQVSATSVEPCPVTFSPLGSRWGKFLSDCLSTGRTFYLWRQF